MKKLLLLATLVLGVVSCMKDQSLEAGKGGESDFVLSVALPSEATRAIGQSSALGAIDNQIDLENTYDIRYVLGVYDAKGNLAKRLDKYEDKATETTFALRLIPGRDYRFVVWADFVYEGSQTALHYNVEDLTNIKLIGDQKAMDETRDAYTSFVDVEKFNAASTVELELKRPFAKLRVVTNDMDELYTQAVLKSGKVVYTQKVYTTFNALTAKAGDLNSVEKEFLYNDATSYTENAADEKTLFADYLFGAENDVIYFTLDIVDETELPIDQVVFNTNIPVKRNHLTTIYGPVLTDANNVSVKIDDNFAQPQPETVIEYKEASTAEELVEVFADLTESTTDEEVHIVLGNNIDLADLAASLFTRASNSVSVTIPEGKNVTLNIKDYVVTGVDNETASFGLFNIAPGAKLTIEGTTGKIQLTATQNRGWNAYSSVVSNQRGEFVLNGGTIEHLGGTDMAYGLDILTNTGAGDAKATINGGVVKSTYRAVRQFLNSTKATAELVVNGGTIDGANNKSIWMQNASNRVNPGKLVVGKDANLYGDVMVSGAGAPELAIELSVAVEALKDNATVIPSSIPAGYALYVKNGNWIFEKGVKVNGNDVEICNAAGLKWVASQVNSGADYFAGKTIVLTADIDLNNEEWAPIGSAEKDHGFMGNFNGNGFAIKNLNITNIALDADGYAYAGLFGITEGVDKDNQNYIKNLTIENVTIETEGHIVAAAIAYPYYTALENIVVKGNVSIKGGDYTSGVLAYTRRCVDAKNISIVAENGSIEGNMTVGGVISDIQMNGGLTANYSNFSAENLTIKGVMHVGGISGILSKQTLNGASVKNVTIVCDDARKGKISGSLGEDSAINGVVVENVAGAYNLVGATYKEGTTHTLTVDGVVYEYLANGTYMVDGVVAVSTANQLVSALAEGNDVCFVTDITVAATKGGYNKAGILQNKAQTIDGNGYTLTVTGAGATWDCAIYTNGGTIKNLTVKGAMRGIFTAGQSSDLNIENVVFKNVIYTFNSDGKMPANPFGVYVSDSVVNGWTSHSNMHSEVVYTNCSFGEGSGYKYCRPYGKTEFVNCTFCAGYTVDQSQTTEITFTDCTFEE